MPPPASPHRCSSCNARVWFARNVTTGAVMILDEVTSDRGNVIREGDGVRVLRKAELDASSPMLPGLEPAGVDPAVLASDVPRWTDHHATCQARS